MNTALSFERSSKEYLVLTLSLAATVGILPFAIHRILTQDWGIAALDSFSIIILLSMFIYVYRTRRIDIACWALALLFLFTEVMTVALKGTSQLIWSFPSTVGVYYLLRVPHATLINTLGLVLITSLIHRDTSTIDLARYLTALISTNIFSIVFAIRNDKLKRKLEALSLHDPLTGVRNRRAFEVYLQHCDQVAIDGHQKRSMIILDIDHFKSVNDKYGHLTGDEVLVRLVGLIRTQLHQDEKIFRIDGEEYAIAPIGMNLSSTVEFSERLRKIVENATMNHQLSITISLGVAEQRSGESAKNWVARADEALHKAKELGRNQTQAAIDSSLPADRIGHANTAHPESRTTP